MRAEFAAGEVVDAITEANDGDRIALLMQILGREVRVSVPAERVNPVAAQ